MDKLGGFPHKKGEHAAVSPLIWPQWSLLMERKPVDWCSVEQTWKIPILMFLYTF